MLLADRYEIGPRLGTGGMAVVHRGHDRLLDRPVALKLLSADRADATARERFLAEARSAARLSHANVVTVHDTGEDGETAFIVLELVEGSTLADRLRSGPLPQHEARRVVGMALDGLAAAHAAGLIHRDVKPANILLTADGTAKLADFGIAKALTEATRGLTATGQVLGTPRYLSPEQVEGREATPATDVYAMGVVLYEALAGRPPFDEATALATAVAHRDRAPHPLEELLPDVDPTLAAVVARALEKDPARRFAEAAAMRSALDSPEVASAATTSSAASTAAIGEMPSARARGRWAAFAVAAMVLLLGGVALLGLRGTGGGPQVSDERQADDAPADADTGASGAGTGAPAVEPQEPLPAGPTTPADAPDLPTMVAVLSEAGEDAYGEKTEDLLDLLLEVLREEPGAQPEEAQEAAEEVDGWVREDELDAPVGARASELLTALASGETSGR